MSASGVRLLMVCTGNICRSPMMERLTADALNHRGVAQWCTVGSAGTWAQPGEPMQPYAASTLAERGVAADGFAATPLGEELVTSADLILTATLDHRSAVVGIAPSAVRRTFTMLELARIAAAAPPQTRQADLAGPDTVRRSIAWAAQMRGSIPRALEGADDLNDPLGAPHDVYRARADAIAGAVGQIVPFLIGPQRGSPAG
ncbi:MAG: hypothetical protein ABI720_04900 [Actinomycetes bacterium]